MSDTERALQVQRRGLFWAVSSGAYRDSLELILRNKVDRNRHQYFERRQERHKVYPLSVWDIVQTDLTGTEKASLRQSLKSSGTQCSVQSCEAM